MSHYYPPGVTGNEPQIAGEPEPPSDADRFQAALQELVAAVRHGLERRINLADHRQRQRLESAFDRYCELIVELHGSEAKG